MYLDIAQTFNAHQIKYQDIAVADERVGFLVEKLADFPHLILTVEIQQIVGSSAGYADILAGIIIDEAKLLGGREKSPD